jgi:predicted metal-dependent enzyme (double-stranded beta helix superfamily)
MSCFIVDNVDSSSVNNFSILKEIIENDDFSFFLDAYSDYFGNFELYTKNNSNYKEKGNYIKLKLHTSLWFDCYLIFWGPDAISPKHDHADNGCLYKVIRGKVRERVYSNVHNLEISQKEYSMGEIGEINNSQGFHRMENIHTTGSGKREKSAVSASVHFYSPPGYQMNVFE